MDGRYGIVVAGGGIGGLTAAIALRQRGHEVVVLERAPELAPVGAGLTLQINAMKALSRLGLLEEVTAAGQIARRATIRSWRGGVLSEADLGRLGEELGAPSVGIHRAELQRVLLSALDGAELRLGVAVRGFSERGGQVTVARSDGAETRADLLIGADGVHSAVRAQLHGDGPPDYAGYTCWRGVCDNDAIAPPDVVSETWGDGRRFGLVPIGHGTLYWFAVADAPEGGHDGPDPKGELLARFAGAHADLARVVEATPSSAMFRTDITDRPTVHPWGQGRVTLLGDAAHPMTPNLGQGACMAIEDAVVLATALDEAADPADALRLYEARRAWRTDVVVDSSRRFGRMGQWSNPIARVVRDALVQATPRFVAERNLRWMYAFEG